VTYLHKGVRCVAATSYRYIRCYGKFVWLCCMLCVDLFVRLHMKRHACFDVCMYCMQCIERASVSDAAVWHTMQLCIEQVTNDFGLTDIGSNYNIHVLDFQDKNVHLIHLDLARQERYIPTYSKERSWQFAEQLHGGGICELLQCE
jgi:hypothetical protein